METRWMALDVGSKTIGVAVSDPLKVTARPLVTIWRETLSQDVRQLRHLIGEYRVERLVIGLPRHLDGRESDTLKIIEPLAQALQEGLTVAIDWADERLSSKEAEEIMTRLGFDRQQFRTRRNELAAAVILTRYIEEGR
jgi:putative holliday junction resolvase